MCWFPPPGPAKVPSGFAAGLWRDRVCIWEGARSCPHQSASAESFSSLRHLRSLSCFLAQPVFDSGISEALRVASAAGVRASWPWPRAGLVGLLAAWPSVGSWWAVGPLVLYWCSPCPGCVRTCVLREVLVRLEAGRLSLLCHGLRVTVRWPRLRIGPGRPLALP